MNTKGILMSILMIGVVAIAAGAGTLAYMSDTETSEGNTFTAGTLDLKVGGQDNPIGAYFTVINVKPGDSGSKTLSIQNVGSLTGDIYIAIDKTSDCDNGCNEPETAVDDSCGTPGDGQGELDDNLDIRVEYYWNGQCVYDTTRTLSGWDSTGEEYMDDMPPGDVDTMVITWSVGSGVEDIIQSDSVTFDVILRLKQA